uniref:Putative tyrosine-protein phosphatase tpte n=1 Tax=Ornithodoros turicata TaxID=34597 RepID=A0A2R5LGG5_9ACAR
MTKYKQFQNESMDSPGLTSGDVEANQDRTEENTMENGHKLNSTVLDTVDDKVARDILLRRFVEHLGFRLFSFILILIDIIILIVDFSTPSENEKGYDIAALCFVCFFVVELLLRLYVQGPAVFFRRWYNVVDFVVVIVSFITTTIYASIEMSGYVKLIVIGRVVRVVGLIRIYTEKKNLTHGARLVVSENKRRYQKDGFDLDLVYVTDRIIAMSYPSSGKMSWYRNPIQEVERFFDTKHPDHYRIYNMCSERTYDNTHFHGRIERVLVDDHNVPLLKDAVEFVRSAQEFLADHPQNIVAVHCKGGKGRTGTMICMLLVENKLFESAKASLEYFGNIRTDKTVGTKFQGVETPSQNRYVEYFEEVKDKHHGDVPEEIPLKVSAIRIYRLTGVGAGTGKDFSCEVFQGRTRVFEMDFGRQMNCQADFRVQADVLEVTPINFPVVQGDVKFRFWCLSSSVPRGYEDCPFYFWFHTSFIKDNRLFLQRDVLDNPHKSKTWKVYHEDFAVELLFTPQTTS